MMQHAKFVVKKISSKKLLLTSELSFEIFIKTGSIIELIAALQEIPFQYYMILFPSYPSCKKDPLIIKVYDKTTSLDKMKIDTRTYSEYFKKNKYDPVVSFFSKRGNTKLIVPRILDGYDSETYKNISTFSRMADVEQQIALWKKVFSELDTGSGEQYINTHGLGVGWLHVRIDKKMPKWGT